ncbi:MAG TPA: metallophosphoesterase [Pseudomonadales bacterium]|nr:metallophosphoesterase [Pseudomonadales bacterium]MDP6316586.1 metallophosphoesterase [Pseudomonadales bacterium]MDP7315981.1 metallophosphoesterase [Pseudomonadales bacterium]HJP51108.1 metallophosphoesterase [Pseudomonadales bacterium]
MSTTETSIREEKRVNQHQWSRFLITTLLLHIPLFFYPILRLADWLALSWWLTLLILIPLSSSQIVSRIYLRSNRQPWAKIARKLADFWLGISPVLLLLLLAFEIIVLFSDLKPHVAAVMVIAISISVSFAGLLVAITPMVKTIRLTSAKLTRPVRFVQITDVHLGSRSRTFLEKIIFKVNRLEVDFLCITGDLIDASGIEERELRCLKSVSGPVYFCTGNHEKYEDLDEILDRLQNLGVTVLRSEASQFREDVQVLGIDDMEDPLQVEKELKFIDLDTEAFKLLLYHRPRGLEAAAEAGIDLIISGHTHNGQIFPFNFVVGRVFDRTEGMYHLGESRQYVSQGTGTWGPVMRLCTRSEITLFEYLPE